MYPELEPTPLQLEEDLEQLKVLEHGYKMKVQLIFLCYIASFTTFWRFVLLKQLFLQCVE